MQKDSLSSKFYAPYLINEHINYFMNDKQVKALQNVLRETQWAPAYETKKKSNDRKPIPTTGWAFFTITSKGVKSIEMADGSKYFETFYKCNFGK